MTIQTVAATTKSKALLTASAQELTRIAELARIKGFEDYTWGEYQGSPLTIESRRGTSFTLKRGDVFGARLSSNKKELRFIFEKLGPTKVFTVDPDIAKNVYKRSKLLGDMDNVQDTTNDLKPQVSKIFQEAITLVRSGKLAGAEAALGDLLEYFDHRSSGELKKSYETMIEEWPRHKRQKGLRLGNRNAKMVKAILDAAAKTLSKSAKAVLAGQKLPRGAHGWAIEDAMYMAWAVSHDDWREAYDTLGDTDFEGLPAAVDKTIDTQYEKMQNDRWND